MKFLTQFLFTTRQAKTFASLYAIYRHYRQAGWIVKNGIQYGTDFVLYVKHFFRFVFFSLS